MKYQEHYSQHFPNTTNLRVRQQKATKAVRLILDFLQREDFAGLRCLDLGCSIGAVSYELYKRNGMAIGTDIDWHAMQISPAYPDKAIFILSDGERLPFIDASFDVIVCSQVYEHVPNLTLLVNEIKRLMKPTGVCFFSGPNKWAVFEDHYRLPLLSWFPKPVADHYVRITGRGREYYEKPRSASELRKVLSPLKIYDATRLLLQNPERYEMGDNALRLKFLFQIIPESAFQLIGAAVPNFNWILTQ
jgi:2-polyprenyl-3-methyl-5-hydroxy-6-metoxy-1,4-benzoquinol methylase